MGRECRLASEFVYAVAMDPLSSLIDAPRGRGSFLLRVPMARPWCIRVRDEAPLTVVAVTDGAAYFTREPDPRCRSRAATCCWCAAPRRTTSATRPAASRSR